MQHGLGTLYLEEDTLSSGWPMTPNQHPVSPQEVHPPDWGGAFGNKQHSESQTADKERNIMSKYSVPLRLYFFRGNETAKARNTSCTLWNVRKLRIRRLQSVDDRCWGSAAIPFGGFHIFQFQCDADGICTFTKTNIRRHFTCSLRRIRQMCGPPPRQSIYRRHGRPFCVLCSWTFSPFSRRDTRTRSHRTRPRAPPVPGNRSMQSPRPFRGPPTSRGYP